MASIDEVIQTIKKSQSTAAANQALQEKFLLDQVQAKAVLDMKLSKLAHLEVQKLEKEYNISLKYLQTYVDERIITQSYADELIREKTNAIVETLRESGLSSMEIAMAMDTIKGV